ncbi:MAG: hypothetical protein GEU99_21485 [Luteitalea sp.]|nr:hypothetical protein [Luteitalea sp.]
MRDRLFSGVSLVAALTTALLSVGSVVCAQPATQSDAAITARGRELTTLFYDGKLDVVWKQASADLKAALESSDKLKAFHSKVLDDLGKEREVLDERASTKDDLSVYVRTARFEHGSTPVEVEWAWDASGVIQGFRIQPKLQEPHLHFHLQSTPTPFEGEGLPATFRNYTADGAHVAAGELRKGQRVSTSGHR